MPPVLSSRPRDAAKPIDDFEWPPKGDEVSIYELGPDPWQALQDASGRAFAAHRRERSQPRPERAAERTARTPKRTRKLAGVLIASAIVAAAAGWALYAAMTRPVPVQSFHHPAPVAAATTTPPPITIVATYPVEPDPARDAPANAGPAVTDPPLAVPGPAIAAPTEAETTPAPSETGTPSGEPAAVDPGANAPEGVGAVRDLPSVR